MRECNVKLNQSKCRCTYEPCDKKGVCCECLRYHFSRGQLPGCLFPKDVESSYDRSIERFVKTYKERSKWW